MSSLIICHYTFYSNDIGSLAGFIFFITLVIFISVALFIWVGNKKEDISLNYKFRRINNDLTRECENILFCESKTNITLKSISANPKWKQWFIKGYIKGAIDGNGFYSPYGESKLHLQSSFEEWEQFEEMQLSHIEEDSDYFGGNKNVAMMAYFIGHEKGVDRYDTQGPA